MSPRIVGLRPARATVAGGSRGAGAASPGGPVRLPRTSSPARRMSSAMGPGHQERPTSIGVPHFYYRHTYTNINGRAAKTFPRAPSGEALHRRSAPGAPARPAPRRVSPAPLLEDVGD